MVTIKRKIKDVRDFAKDILTDNQFDALSKLLDKVDGVRKHLTNKDFEFTYPELDECKEQLNNLQVENETLVNEKEILTNKITELQNTITELTDNTSVNE